MLTQKRLKEMLDYNPETGVLTWVISQGRVKTGDICNSKCRYGYVMVRLNSKKYRAHRLAFLYMTGKWPEFIDHINHVRDDNRWVNLREVTYQENNRNASISKNNKSGFTGVCWITRDEKWLAKIVINKKPVYLGFYGDRFEAICARASANNKYGFHPNHGAAK